jgi:hypothetical protein
MKKPGSVESASAFAKSNADGNARTSADFSAEYQSRTDEDLLQLCVERSELSNGKSSATGAGTLFATDTTSLIPWAYRGSRGSFREPATLPLASPCRNT